VPVAPVQGARVLHSSSIRAGFPQRHGSGSSWVLALRESARSGGTGPDKGMPTAGTPPGAPVRCRARVKLSANGADGYWGFYLKWISRGGTERTPRSDP
jgi:hypothetical protein